MPEINWLAALAAAVSSFVVGGLWYTPALFGKAWQREAGVTDEQIKTGNPAKIFGGALVLSIVAAVVFAMFLGPNPDVGFAAGLCWVAATVAHKHAKAAAKNRAQGFIFMMV